MGEKSIGQEFVAVVLGLVKNSKEAESTLLGLSSQMPARDRIIVLVPFFDRTSQTVLNNLESQKILVARSEEAFPKSGFYNRFCTFGEKETEAGRGVSPKNTKTAERL